MTIASAGQIWACKGFGSSESCEFINPTQSSQCIFEGQSINLATRMNVQSDLRVLGGEIDSGNFKVDSPQQPLFAFVAGTNEPMFDAFDGSVSMNQFSGACYDNLGNNTLNAVDTYTDAAANNRIERKRTDNIYSNLAGTAGGTFRWRLGRMTASNVTHTRQNPAQLGQTLSETRALAFSYDTGVISSTAQPNTGFLKSERSQQTAADAAEDVRTQHFRDVFGNVTIKMSCSREVPLSDCDDPTDISKVIHRPTREGKTLEWVHRYAETRFDTRLSPALQRGRFADESIVPYFDGTTSGNSTAAVSRSKVLARNAFGDAIQTTDLNGVDQVMAYGALGRMYYQWTETVQNSNLNSGGVTSTTRLRWCGSQANEVSCPTGAIFRQSVISNLGQASFTYFDVLGRELLSSSLGFNDPQDASIGGGASFNAKQFVAVCKFHEAHGRNSRVSEPFFLSDTPTTPGEPRFSGDPCAARDWTITQYDGLGREKQTIYPDGGTKTVSYGKAISPTASPLSTRTVMTQSAGVQLVSTITKNALGEIVQTIDDAGLVADFDYDIQGNQIAMRRTSDVQRAEVKTTMQYDRSGRKISEFDPDSGGSSTRYNALGEVIRVTDAKGQISENHYDALGRVWKRIATGAGGGGDLIMKSGFEDGETPSAPSGGNSYTDVFTFDTANNGLGQLASEQRSGSTTYFRSFSFDSLGRPSATNTSFDAANYSESTSYDSFGRVLSITDATGGTLAHRYSARGYMYQLYELASGQIYYQVIEQDARGNVLREQKHGSVSLQTVRNYEPQTGRLLSIQSGSGGSIQSLNYEYDLLDNLTRRQDLRAGHSERFEYDRFNRLTRSFLDRVNNVNVGQINTFTASFDALGNICQKNGNGYGYDGAAGCGLHGSGGFAFNQSTASPHAVKAAFGFTYGYDANGNQTLRSGGQTRSIDYDVDDLATQITLGNEQTRFSYGPGGSRYRRLDLQNNAVQKTTRYVGNVEIVFGSQCETKRYIGGALILIDKFANNVCGGSTVKEYHYQFGDHLGSLDVLTNEFGSIRERFAFNAHGERRAVLDWQGTGLASVATTRGFTGHEHVENMGLIHMNARLYDAQLGRFVQPDPIIQDTLNAQNLNRYSYVLNNPLSLTDPSGASWFSKYWRTILSLAINIFLPGAGAFWTAIGVSSSMGIAVITGFVSGVVSSGSLKGGLWSAFSAGLFSKIGSYFEGASWAKASGSGVLKTGLNAGGYAAKVLSHGVAGGVMNSLQGGKFGHGFISAGVAQGASGVIDGIDPSNLGFSPSRTFAAAMLGGSVSAATGGKFASGAATAAFSRAFNDEMHECSFLSEAAESVGNVLSDYKDGFDNFITSDAVVNGVAGAGDVASFGASRYIRDSYGIGNVDQSSNAYANGQIVGIPLAVASTAAGGIAINVGIRSAGGASRLYHFTSTAGARAIIRSGVLRPGSRQIYGPGAYATIFRSPILGRLAGAANTGARVTIRGQSQRAIATPFPGTFRFPGGTGL